MAPTPDMTGKVVLITGATSGIGLAAARALASAGATIAMVGRSPGRAEDAHRDVVAAAANPERVALLTADLSSLADVRRLAADVQSGFEQLDVLFNNAGVDVGARALTVDGHELTFAVNYLAPFVLTTSLLPLLTSSAPARVLTAASSGHRGGKLDIEHLERVDGRFSGQAAYNSSKLALVLFTYELARRLDGTRVTANCVDPGFVKGTALGRTLPKAYQFIGMVLTPFMVSPERGAQTAVWAASSAELATTTGTYFKRGKQVRSSEATYDVDLARRLWDATEALLAGGSP